MRSQSVRVFKKKMDPPLPHQHLVESGGGGGGGGTSVIRVFWPSIVESTGAPAPLTCSRQWGLAFEAEAERLTLP